jgi:hypothetical protein
MYHSEASESSQRDLRAKEEGEQGRRDGTAGRFRICSAVEMVWGQGRGKTMNAQSPFPGMDPYIEARGLWRDFHTDLMTSIKYTLADLVPEKYVVRLEERSYITLAGAEGKEEYPFFPDVRVVERSTKPRKRAKSAPVAVTDHAIETDGITMQAFIAEEHRESFIEIYEDDPERQLVTCIEVLSPSNKKKKSKGRKLYLRKRQSLLLGTANLVELDLLRGGQRMPMRGTWPDSPYTLLVCRESRAPLCNVWPAHFRTPLPVLPIPLSHPDPDIPIDLQTLIARVYARSRYDRDIDYGKTLDPPLRELDAAWLAERLKEGRRRSTKR